jgi:diaminohydroxyphosphoribosylaminopyrimidine deaminase/5-amino-6-(5-phosphoribosylamino)uracil reductase
MHGDADLMARAVRIGERGRVSAPPNPWVGCTIVREGAVVGEGHHVRPGEAHAEVAALRATGSRARGATAYVTLEPCAHRGRTGPCVDALLEAGIARVVVALEDPDPQVQGRGFAALRAAGVEVEIGIGAREARASLAPYLHHRSTGRSFCLAKVALSIDGRIAAADGTSRWITDEAARADAHQLRAESQAIVIGSGTALADAPALTVRGVTAPPQPPLRVVLDARGRVPATGPLFEDPSAPTLVVTSEDAPLVTTDAWQAAGAKVEIVPRAAGGEGLVLRDVLSLLGRYDVLQAMVEGGARLHGALVADDLVDHLVAYVAPTVLGIDALPAFAWNGPGTLAAAPRFELEAVSRLGDDARFDLRRETEVG